MRIEDAKKAYSAHLSTLQEQRNTLTELLKDSENSVGITPDFDRVEISRELSEIDAEYKVTQKYMDHILASEHIVRSSAEALQQGEAAAEGAKEFGRILTIYRRIASGGIVPAKDEQRLMEFSHELYMAAKAAAALATGKQEEYDSLWEDDKKSFHEEKTPDEIAADTQIAVPSPERAAAMVCSE